MKATEIRTKDDAELMFDLKNLRKELFTSRMQAVMEGAANPSKIRETRRQIARVLTLLRERRLGVRGQSPRT